MGFQTCKDWSLEDREILGVRPACIISKRIGNVTENDFIWHLNLTHTVKLIVKNKIYWDRKCGQIGGENDTCELEEDKYPGIPVTCTTCEIDWCNGSDDSDSNLIFLLFSTVFVISIRML
jgi:hypothetical protein